jgi:hypothetical protein
VSISFGGTSLFLPIDNSVSPNTTSPKIRLSSVTGEFQYYKLEEQNFNSMGQPRARYWRYVHDTPIKDHHPRVTRIMFHDDSGRETVIIRYANDVISGDIGNIPGLDVSATITFDYGSGSLVRVLAVSAWMGFAVSGNVTGSRASSYRVEYSQDNSNWSTYFGGIMANYPQEDGIATTANTRSANNYGIFFGSGRATTNI